MKCLHENLFVANNVLFCSYCRHCRVNFQWIFLFSMLFAGIFACIFNKSCVCVYSKQAFHAQINSEGCKINIKKCYKWFILTNSGERVL